MCGSHKQCVKTVDNKQYHCVCKPGYAANGKSCGGIRKQIIVIPSSVIPEKSEFTITPFSRGIRENFDQKLTLHERIILKMQFNVLLQFAFYKFKFPGLN